MFQLENFRGIVCHDTKGNAKFKERLTPGLKNDIRDFVDICTLISSFCPKHIKIQMKKYRKVISHDNEDQSLKKLLVPKKHEKLGEL